MPAAAHVAEGALAGAVGAAAAHARDPGHGAPGAPRLGRGLVTGVLVDGVGLAVVLGHLVVDGGDDVRADGRAVDGREAHSLPRGLVLLRVDRHGRAGGGHGLKRAKGEIHLGNC